MSKLTPFPSQATETRGPPGPLAGVRLAIVEDLQLWRDLVGAVMADQGAEIVGREATVAGAVALIAASTPDVVLLDLYLDREDGLDVIRQVQGQSPRTKWVLLTANAKPFTLRTALRLGVQGVVMKTVDSKADLVTGVTKVASGGEYYSKAVGKVLAELVRSEHSVRLSPQEEQVLKRLAAGETIKEVAYALKVEAGTVGKYLQRIRDKWDLAPSEPVVAVVEAAHRLGFLNRTTGG